MKKVITAITEAESEIMKILWDLNEPVLSTVIVEKMTEQQGWGKSTTLTLIGRLADKKALKSAGKNGKAYYYLPLVTKKEYLKQENSNFIQRLYGGRVKNLIAALCNEEKLSDEEIDELRTILDERS